jgi:hypothetical protein
MASGRHLNGKRSLSNDAPPFARRLPRAGVRRRADMLTAIAIREGDCQTEGEAHGRAISARKSAVF